MRDKRPSMVSIIRMLTIIYVLYLYRVCSILVWGFWAFICSRGVDLRPFTSRTGVLCGVVVTIHRGIITQKSVRVKGVLACTILVLCVKR